MQTETTLPNFITVTCRHCPAKVTFDKNITRWRNTCDSCKRKKLLEAVMRGREKSRDRFRLGADEVVGQSGESELNKLAVRTQQEVALILGTSHAMVQRAERSAMLFMRAYLKKVGAGLVVTKPLAVRVTRGGGKPLSYAPFVELIKETLLEELNAPEAPQEVITPPSDMEARYRHFRETGEILTSPEDPPASIEKIGVDNFPNVG